MPLVYEVDLVERVRASTVDELKTLLAFFDCVQLRERHLDLLVAVRKSLSAVGNELRRVLRSHSVAADRALKPWARCALNAFS